MPPEEPLLSPLRPRRSAMSRNRQASMRVQSVGLDAVSPMLRRSASLNKRPQTPERRLSRRGSKSELTNEDELNSSGASLYFAKHLDNVQSGAQHESQSNSEEISQSAQDRRRRKEVLLGSLDKFTVSIEGGEDEELGLDNLDHNSSLRVEALFPEADQSSLMSPNQPNRTSTFVARRTRVQSPAGKPRSRSRPQRVGRNHDSSLRLEDVAPPSHRSSFGGSGSGGGNGSSGKNTQLGDSSAVLNAKQHGLSPRYQNRKSASSLSSSAGNGFSSSSGGGFSSPPPPARQRQKVDALDFVLAEQRNLRDAAIAAEKTSTEKEGPKSSEKKKSKLRGLKSAASKLSSQKKRSKSVPKRESMRKENKEENKGKGKEEWNKDEKKEKKQEKEREKKEKRERKERERREKKEKKKYGAIECDAEVQPRKSEPEAPRSPTPSPKIFHDKKSASISQSQRKLQYPAPVSGANSQLLTSTPMRRRRALAEMAPPKSPRRIGTGSRSMVPAAPKSPRRYSHDRSRLGENGRVIAAPLTAGALGRERLGSEDQRQIVAGVQFAPLSGGFDDSDMPRPANRVPPPPMDVSFAKIETGPKLHFLDELLSKQPRIRSFDPSRQRSRSEDANGHRRSRSSGHRPKSPRSSRGAARARKLSSSVGRKTSSRSGSGVIDSVGLPNLPHLEIESTNFRSDSNQSQDKIRQSVENGGSCDGLKLNIGQSEPQQPHKTVPETKRTASFDAFNDSVVSLSPGLLSKPGAITANKVSSLTELCEMPALDKSPSKVKKLVGEEVDNECDRKNETLNEINPNQEAAQLVFNKSNDLASGVVVMVPTSTSSLIQSLSVLPNVANASNLTNPKGSKPAKEFEKPLPMRSPNLKKPKIRRQSYERKSLIKKEAALNADDKGSACKSTGQSSQTDDSIKMNSTSSSKNGKRRKSKLERSLSTPVLVSEPKPITILVPKKDQLEEEVQRNKAISNLDFSACLSEASSLQSTTNSNKTGDDEANDNIPQRSLTRSSSLDSIREKPAPPDATKKNNVNLNNFLSAYRDPEPVQKNEGRSVCSAFPTSRERLTRQSSRQALRRTTSSHDGTASLCDSRVAPRRTFSSDGTVSLGDPSMYRHDRPSRRLGSSREGRDLSSPRYNIRGSTSETTTASAPVTNSTESEDNRPVVSLRKTNFSNKLRKMDISF